jgi:hypothetical protein
VSRFRDEGLARLFVEEEVAGTHELIVQIDVTQATITNEADDFGDCRCPRVAGRKDFQAVFRTFENALLGGESCRDVLECFVE